MTSNSCKWLISQQVADELGVHVETVRRWLRAGEIQGVKLSEGPRGKWLIHRDELNKFLARHTYMGETDELFQGVK